MVDINPTLNFKSTSTSKVRQVVRITFLCLNLLLIESPSGSKQEPLQGANFKELFWYGSLPTAKTPHLNLLNSYHSQNPGSESTEAGTDCDQNWRESWHENPIRTDGMGTRPETR